MSIKASLTGTSGRKIIQILKKNPSKDPEMYDEGKFTCILTDTHTPKNYSSSNVALHKYGYKDAKK
jgi:hypothetical protein